jgi:hypothetical protein
MTGRTHRFFRVGTLALALTALAMGCRGCGPGDAGEQCNPDNSDSCVEGLVCADDGDGGNVCLIPRGAECTPDDDEDFCQGDSECVEVDDDEIDGRCLVSAGGACEADEECAPGLVCAETTSDEDQCWAEVLIRGQVFDSETDEGIEGAHVIALNDESSAVSDIAISGEGGTYDLPVPVVRDADGKPTDELFTLRASAQDYQTFPGGIRTALPLDASTAAQEEGEGDKEGPWVIENTITRIALIALPDDQQGRPSIAGEVVSDTREAGVLVVAETGGAGYSAVSDVSGAFTIFNVPDGSFEVKGYAAGVQLNPENVDVAGEDVTGVELTEAEEGTVTVTGQINPVEGAPATTVVLVVESTFDETFARGEVPSGLRAPKTGPPSITGEWTIEGVPAGNYVVLAAFENDDAVRDPDQSIAGTDTVTITVPAGGETFTVQESFKVTEALDVISPGANEPEGLASAPTLRWQDDSSEKYYEVRVFNAFGEEVWNDLMVPEVSGGSEVSIQYGGPFEDGMYYQFRATSFRTPGGMATPISTTEDLRGVFFKE